MTRIEGEPLERVWKTINEAQKDSIKEQLGIYLAKRPPIASSPLYWTKDEYNPIRGHLTSITDSQVIIFSILDIPVPNAHCHSQAFTLDSSQIA
ncbi:hypothetical protein PAAG_08474 [Paracoccidioides lutzii Pb01]|uniref:Uncharacterized protein n=1 Tax=Paracoccidioides lutzii (strain ATCC MYA-826 / Pb01) TaxID=502779 RepID=C1HCI3_PARBA|nr:hypothetical protein PAAG_08474 [Paracoccidioides lutzii Pb01]EEH38747.2 hypothetical protein PAAG_08474 [Paracoccidioides lutzii Pb01]